MMFETGVEQESTHAHRLEHVLGLLVHIQHAALVLSEVQSRDLGDVLILPLTLLFLKLEGDAANGATLDALHQVSGVAGDLSIPSRQSRSSFVQFSIRPTHLVPQPLAGNQSNLIAYSLVRLEVEGEFGVVALDNDLGRLLDRLRSDTTHVCGGVGGVVRW